MARTVRANDPAPAGVAGTPTVGGASASGSPGASTGAPEEEDSRQLKGHRFLVPIAQEHIPFATTHFGVRQGVLLLSIPRVPLGPLGTLDIAMSGLVQAFDAGVKLTDWLGLTVVGTGLVTTGVNVESIVLGGATLSMRLEAGPLLRLFRSDSSGTQIAATLTGGGGTGRNVTVQPLINGLADAPQATLESVLRGELGRLLLVPTSQATVTGSIMAAQTLSPNFGLLASASARYENRKEYPFDAASRETTELSSNDMQLRGALAATADGAPSGVPFGVMLEYMASHATGWTNSDVVLISTLQHFLTAGFYYTGRRDLQVGIAGAMQLGMKPIEGIDSNNEPAQSGAPGVYYGQFILRYVW